MLLALIFGQTSFELDVLVSDESLSLEEWIGGLMNKNKLGRAIDPNLLGNYVEEEEEQLVQLALLCSIEVATMIESQMLGQDPSRRSNWSGSEYDSTPHYFSPSSSLASETCLISITIVFYKLSFWFFLSLYDFHFCLYDLCSVKYSICFTFHHFHICN
ncbi:hypothetical protein ACJRO7_007720 [Eucalyptus globulus]|uniref:Uncharacterized protein n=1 Tax=Eucalyptus globulus TaxID=34317 RepID=A0ABD3ILY7_EUCGL